MKVRKIRSIRRASFLGMMGGGFIFALINFIVFAVFLVTLAYLFISNQEDNLSKILINDLTAKQERITYAADSLSDMIAKDNSKDFTEMHLENSVLNFKEIQGVLILNDQGIITESSRKYKDYIGLDFSGKDYYKKMVSGDEKKTFISSSYVSHQTKRLTMSVISPILKDNKLSGMVVVLINPSIIENNELNDMEYYLVDSSGDIIFKSNESSLVTKEDNIRNSLIMNSWPEKKNALFYEDKLINESVLGIIRKEPLGNMYVIVQHNIFGNTAMLKGLTMILAIAVAFIILFILLFSIQASSVVTSYINIFNSEVKKISGGNYDIRLSNKYPHTEINEIIDSFNNMAHKIKVREEELQAYNEELVAANDEIKSMLLTLSKTEKERKEQYLQIIWTMVNLLEIKDEYTAGHSKSVTYYAEQIVERLNNNYGFKLDVERIQIAAILHDIGKIGIHREILNKPSKLTEEEYEIIKSHPSKGYYALKDIESLKQERKIIKYHHEKYDGTGYPEGLKGDEIPLGARIICVADAFDAMVSDRPYRKGLSLEVAVSELVKYKGTQFDPLVVDVFVEMLSGEGQIGSHEA